MVNVVMYYTYFNSMQQVVVVFCFHPQIPLIKQM